MNLPAEANEHLYQFADELYTSVKEDPEAQVLLFYPGDLSEGYSNALAARLELILDAEVADRQAIKRFFYAFVEAVQNVRIHACRSHEGVVPGAIIVYKRGSTLCTTVVNIATQAQARMLARRHEEVNALSAEELKKRYLDTLQNGEFSDKGGAGLGIITMVMRSKHPVSFRCCELSEVHSLVHSTIMVKIEG